MHSPWKAVSALLVLALAACNTAAPPVPQPPQSKDITGTVRLNLTGEQSALEAAQLHILPTVTDAPKPPARLEFVPGEVLVKVRNTVSAQSAQVLSVGGVSLQAVRSLGLENTRLYRTDASVQTAGPDATLALVNQLKARADVAWAQPNYIMHALAVPNDPAYKYQWHYEAIKLPAAWDIEKGTSNPVTVAVIDTGILKAHPDLEGKILPGYDFITNPQNANDGDGRDADADDPGDTPGGQSSYHGSHVAGTIAAASNNGKGVSGVSWGAKILPVRVLGVQGGTLADIADSMLWAAGLSVPGVPANPNPAQVLNMSLGGTASCDQVPLYGEVIGKVNAKGAIIVVAAGNENMDANNSVPANCSGVITVGATDFAGKRARYSNYGPRVDVMAPGGDVKVDLNGDQYPDGVLSTIRNDQNGEYLYSFKNGTSMATPHVAGVIALLKSRDPGLSLTRALDILKRTARPLSASDCSGPGPQLTDQDCGAGLIDAEAALKALGGGTNPGPGPTPPPPAQDFSLSLNPSSLTMTPNSSQNVTLSIARVGGFNSTVGFSTEGAPAGLTFSLSNSTPSGGTLTVEVGNVARGSYAVTVIGTANGATRLTRTVSLSLRVETTAPAKPSIQGTAVLACYYLGNDCDVVKSRAVTIGNPGTSGAFALRGLEDGKYLLIAWKDVNGDEEVNSGDYIGIYTENANYALIQPPASSLNLEVSPISGTGSFGAGVLNLERQQRAAELARRWWAAHPAR